MLAGAVIESHGMSTEGSSTEQTIVVWKKVVRKGKQQKKNCNTHWNAILPEFRSLRQGPLEGCQLEMGSEGYQLEMALEEYRLEMG